MDGNEQVKLIGARSGEVLAKVGTVRDDLGRAQNREYSWITTMVMVEVVVLLMVRVV